MRKLSEVCAKYAKVLKQIYTSTRQIRESSQTDIHKFAKVCGSMRQIRESSQTDIHKYANIHKYTKVRKKNQKFAPKNENFQKFAKKFAKIFKNIHKFTRVHKKYSNTRANTRKFAESSHQIFTVLRRILETVSYWHAHP